jgi:hypothetical protein
MKMKFCVAALFILSTIVSAQAKITFAGGNGSSQQQAIRIVGAKGEMDGVHAEYIWLKKNRPDCKPGTQSLVQGKRIYDVMEISCGGKRQSVYFDITGYFGKF